MNKNFFNGRKIVIATMHEKEKIIAPILKNNLNLTPIILKNFDTDKYGTFAGEVKRKLNQLDTARKKAFDAIRISGVDLAIASEGSFGLHPSLPFIQSNLEVVVLIDQKNGFEISGYFNTTETNMDGQYVSSSVEAISFARKVGFPEHGVIVKKRQDSKFNLFKNIKTEKELENIVNKLLKSIFTKKIFIETDMRAHKNPTRMKAIEQATFNLVKNIQSECPKCFSPGFIVNDIEKGLICFDCSMPTILPKNYIFMCMKCNYVEKTPNIKHGKQADPFYCGYCNP